MQKDEAAQARRESLDGSPDGAKRARKAPKVFEAVPSHSPRHKSGGGSAAAGASGGKAKATAKTVYGALRALETFSQLVRFDFDANAYALPGAPWDITDSPRFPHRGLMVDTARARAEKSHSRPSSFS